ncbi:MAG: hypothetical protein ACRDBX_06260 [Erysipelotrichaceae bacterium]
MNLTIAQFLALDFTLYEHNPILKHFGWSPILADPSVLLPKDSPTQEFVLFAHTLFGVYAYRSKDPLHFAHRQKVVSRAMRPNINLIEGKYVLYYEKTKWLGNVWSLFGQKWASHIAAKTSDDLKHWSAEQVVLAASQDIETSSRGVSLSNPFLLPHDEGYRLYYSCGLTFIEDCGFCEPTYVSVATSQNPLQGFEKRSVPLLSPSGENPYLNLGAGCLKVYRLVDGYVGLQNGIYQEGGRSKSAIVALTSSDGLAFTPQKIVLAPQMQGNNAWMAQYVYASHLIEHEGMLYLYFNARNTAHFLKGTESIGVAMAKMPASIRNEEE